MGYDASFSWLIHRLGRKNERGNRGGGQKVRAGKKGLFSEI